MCACCYRCSFTLGGKGGVETAMSYDLSHNLLLQIVGTKRVTLLPPSAHRRLHLSQHEVDDAYNGKSKAGGEDEAGAEAPHDQPTRQ